MNSRWAQTLLQAAACLVCAVIVIRDPYDLSASEYFGGWLSGPLAKWSFSGALLLALAFLVTFAFRRIAAVVAITGGLLSVPLSLDFVTPTLYGWMFRLPPTPFRQQMFVLNTWALSRLLAVAVVIGVCIRSLRARGPASSK